MNFLRNIHHRFKRQTKTSKDPRDNLTSLIRASIKSAGLWTGSPSHWAWWLGHFAAFFYQGNLILQFIAMIMARNDTKRLFECFSVFTFSGMGVLKLQSLRKDSARWLYILSQAEDLHNEQLERIETDVEYETDDEGNAGESFLGHINKYTAKCQFVSNILKKVYWITLIIFISTPFIEYWLIINEESTYPHILPSWTPLENLGFYGYFITIVLESVSAIYCVVIHVAFDLAAVGMMIFLTGQFSLLTEYSQRIAGRGDRCEYSRERDVRAHHRIRKCHYIHLRLNNILRELNLLLMNILGIYYLVATLTLCSVAVRLISEEMGIMQLVSLLQYMCGTLTQLLLFCYFGDALLHESSVGMGQGPFAAAYWCVRPRVRRELVLLGIGMMRPRLLRAGYFYTLDLPSFLQNAILSRNYVFPLPLRRLLLRHDFVTEGGDRLPGLLTADHGVDYIVRTAYSYYAVLRK